MCAVYTAINNNKYHANFKLALSALQHCVIIMSVTSRIKAAFIGCEQGWSRFVMAEGKVVRLYIILCG